jgi:cholesterol oxidase
MSTRLSRRPFGIAAGLYPGNVTAAFDYDVLVIGSGFGGSVTALRLTEKGYRVAVVEAGRRFTDQTLPSTSWALRDFLWAPALGCYGIQRITKLGDVMVLSGAGVGGGSLNYANTLYQPLGDFYTDRQWAHITDWRAELAPYYGQARRMLGVTKNPSVTPSDVAMKDVADSLGVGNTFVPTDVGVYFGRPGETVPDPYFGGAGPHRAGCIECGDCMVGCRYGAKNRLDRNYLYLAESAGCRILPETTVTAVAPLPEGGYRVSARSSRARRKRRPGEIGWTAEHVVFSAGTLGTQDLLHRLREDGTLSRLSARLGELTRTNSESLLGAMAKTRAVDYSRGVAITSSFYPDARTHVEPVRYGKGSNAMGLLATALTDGGPGPPRWARWAREVARHPVLFARTLVPYHWSERSIIVLVMQSLDNSLTVSRHRGRLTTRPGHGEPNPTWIPVGNEVARRLADRIGGYPGGTWGEVFDVPMTAHILGGAVLGDSPATGVVDPYHRVYGHPGLHVVDGSAVPANLGVNPALTITAMAERAMAYWPNRGEPDPRPGLGEAYRQLTPVPPVRATVPAGAPAELRFDRPAPVPPEPEVVAGAAPPAP